MSSLYDHLRKWFTQMQFYYHCDIVAIFSYYFWFIDIITMDKILSAIYATTYTSLSTIQKLSIQTQQTCNLYSVKKEEYCLCQMTNITLYIIYIVDDFVTHCYNLSQKSPALNYNNCQICTIMIMAMMMLTGALLHTLP